MAQPLIFWCRSKDFLLLFSKIYYREAEGLLHIEFV